MSDWSAQHSGVSSALAGLDMTMPGDTVDDSGISYWGANLTIAVLNGTVPQSRLDDMATRIIAAWYYVGRVSSPSIHVSLQPAGFRGNLRRFRGARRQVRLLITSLTSHTTCKESTREYTDSEPMTGQFICPHQL